MSSSSSLSLACFVFGLAIGFFALKKDGNSQAEFKNGFPSNCRALVQANIDGWRSGEYKAENIIASLERNCGAMGQLWDQ